MPSTVSIPPSSRNVLKTRVRLDLRKKVDIINFLASGKKLSEAVRHFQISRGSVAPIHKNKDKLLKEFSQNGNQNTLAFWKSPFDALDEPLTQWVGMLRDNNIPVTGLMIQEKALLYASEIGLTGFIASNGWLHRKCA